MRKDFFSSFFDWRNSFYDLFVFPPLAFEPYRKTSEEKNEVAGDLTCNKESEAAVKNDGAASNCGFLRVFDAIENWPVAKIYTPKFEFDKEESLWVYKLHVGKRVKPEDIELYISGDEKRQYLNLFYRSSSEDGSSTSCASAGIDIPGDKDSIKAKLKGGELTITCEPIPAREEVAEEEKEGFDPEKEYEIEVDKL